MSPKPMERAVHKRETSLKKLEIDVNSAQKALTYKITDINKMIEDLKAQLRELLYDFREPKNN